MDRGYACVFEEKRFRPPPDQVQVQGMFGFTVDIPINATSFRAMSFSVDRGHACVFEEKRFRPGPGSGTRSRTGSGSRSRTCLALDKDWKGESST